MATIGYLHHLYFVQLTYVNSNYLCPAVIVIRRRSENYGSSFALIFSGPSCPENWNFYNEFCYYPSASTDKVDQATARTKCQAMDADLVSISDQAEMDFVQSISYEQFILKLLIS